MGGVSSIERARNRTLVYLAILASPGRTQASIADETGIGMKAVARVFNALEHEGLVMTKHIGAGRVDRAAYPIKPADPEAAQRLAGLLYTMTTSRADIQEA